MSDGSGRITLDWGDGEHIFRLAMKQLSELQDKTDAGPEMLYRRIADGQWKVADLRETIRLGLIGGGMDEVEAIKLVRRYFDDSGLIKHKATAAAIILAALMGPPDDTPSAGKETRRRAKAAGESPSQHSSEMPASSA